MKKNVIEVPIKAEVEFLNKRGVPYKTPQLIKTNTYTSKGRDKDWYEARKKKNLQEPLGKS